AFNFVSNTSFIQVVIVWKFCRVAINVILWSVKEGPDSLSWASAQINCQCSVSESRVFLPRMHQLSSEDISTSITYSEIIPVDAPPSFRGQAVKYSYKLTLGTQRLNHPTKLLRIPFRVLVLHGLNDLSVYLDPEEVQPSNPFLLSKKEDTVMDVALHILETVTARKGPHSYNITNTRGRVARCILFKTAFKLGEDIIGIMDFSDTTVPCVQYCVTLQSEETISEECRKKNTQGSSLTSYRWRLHFEFVTSNDAMQGETRTNEDGSTSWRGPASMNVETMVWDLPVKIFPSNPVHASSVTLLKLLHTVNV
ncbi:RGP1-like protein, partial [Mya arenaria]